MKKKFQRINLSEYVGSGSNQAEVFALLNLGVLDWLSSGKLTAEDALHVFYHGDNVFFVDKLDVPKYAEDIMGRGVQLADLFDVLPVDKAERAFASEVEKMRSLCLKMLASPKRNRKAAA